MSFTNTPSSKATISITAIPTIESKSTHRWVEIISNTIPRKNTNKTINHRSGCLSVERTLIIKFFRASLAYY